MARQRRPGHLDQCIGDPLTHPPVLVAEEAEQLRPEPAVGVAHLLGKVGGDALDLHVAAPEQPEDGP